MFISVLKQVKGGRNLLWYLNRLKTMSLPETTYRIGQVLRKKYAGKFKLGYFPKITLTELPRPILFFPESAGPFSTDTYPIFGKNLDLTQPIDWHEDIISQTRFPHDFSFSIDTRTEQHGIAKVVWEVNRLQFLTNICLAYRFSGDQQYLDRFTRIIDSWHQSNPYLMGVNWYSNIEINLRIITWFLCWEILDATALCRNNAAFKKFADDLWLPLIYLHASHAYRHPSKYSSSNNHLIAEACGLFIAGAYWKFPGYKKWVRYAKSTLEREMQLQHSPNGINREEASEYIQFITDFFLIAHIAGGRCGYPFSEKYLLMLKKIMHYIHQLNDISGHVPYYGDDDDGRTFWLSDRDSFNNFQSLLVSGAALFNDPGLKTGSARYDLKNEILFGPQGRDRYQALTPGPANKATNLFKEEGHFLIKKGDDKQEIYLHVDAAPLGYLSIAAHGHADALSFFLHLDGIPFIVDVGTYTYHSEPEWRAYFKGTLAHNTIRVDEQDQASNAGPCLWLNHYEIRLHLAEEQKEAVLIKAGHNGYTVSGVYHTRAYQFNKEKDTLLIVDTIDCNNNKPHIYEVPFHLHPQIRVRENGRGVFELSAESTDRRVLIRLDEQLDPILVKGKEDPILGWYSGSFLQKAPTTTIYSRMEKSGSFQLRTEITILSE